MADIDEKIRNAILAQLFQQSTWRYSSVRAAVLRYLADTPHPVTITDLSRNVLKSGRHDDSTRVRMLMYDLRRSLQNYFEDTEDGKKSPFRIELPARTSSGGYQITFVPNIPKRPPLKVFLCHSSGDKKAVRRLHARLTKDGFLPWLDQQDLLPGQNWEAEIKKAVRNSDVVLVCMSPSSITKQGFVQKEIKMALDAADEKPFETIYIIPALLKACVVPERLKPYQWTDLYKRGGYNRLVASLRTFNTAN